MRLRRLAALAFLGVVTVACSAVQAPPESAASRTPTDASRPTAPSDPPARSSPSAATCESAVLLAGDFVRMAADDPLACFGSRTVEVHGYLSEMGGVGGCHVQFIPGDGWLDLCAAPLPIVVGNLTDSDGLAFHLAPGLDPDDAPRGSIVRLVGHFDDPAAQSCGVEGGTAADTAAARESCRRAFVVEEITSIR